MTTFTGKWLVWILVGLLVVVSVAVLLKNKPQNIIQAEVTEPVKEIKAEAVTKSVTVVKEGLFEGYVFDSESCNKAVADVLILNDLTKTIKCGKLKSIDQ